MRRARGLATVVVGATLLLGAGCGGDSENADKTTPTITTESVPTATQTTETAITPTTPVPTTPKPTITPPGAPNSGGTTVPATPKPRTTPDGPGNDTPAAPDSPAGRFEKYCDANPGACG